MKEAFIDKKFTAKSLQKLEWIDAILSKYRSMGYDLTVRQVYYQLVAQDLIPNNVRSYNQIQSLISAGRKAGLISWDMIVDRTRATIIPPHWSSPGDIVQASVDHYANDKWRTQENHLEIMCEKQALAGILEPVCQELDVNFTSNRGYASDSLMYQVAQRLAKKAMAGKAIYVLYFGDHDPSGLDMDRDIASRLEMFSYLNFETRRLALLMNQVEEMNLPENPAKSSDSRYANYLYEFGDSSWELDAVEPDELVRLTTEAVESLRDDDLWEVAVEEEEEGRQELQEFADQYLDV